MSGPIVRKYGFPNHDQIFGNRPLEHGVEEDDSAAEQPVDEGSAETAKKPPAKKKTTKPKKS